MTVPVSDRLSPLYVGNGVQVRFDFTFNVFQQEDSTGITIRVKNGSEFEAIDPAKYAVTLNNDGKGGYITFISPPDITQFFYIMGSTAVDQLLDITNYNNFYPDALERALDKITAILQEWYSNLDQETLSRILADINYDNLAKQREADLKAYIDGIASAIFGWPVIGLPSVFIDTGINDLPNQKLFNEKSVTTVESVADLASIMMWEGRTVYVKSYYRGEKRGGGFFTYDSQLKNTNNKFTVINGWGREAKTHYSPYDIGLHCDSKIDGDVTNTLNIFFEILPPVCEIKLDGDFFISSQIIVKDKISVIVEASGAKITGDPDNWITKRYEGIYFNFNSSYTNPVTTQSSAFVWGGFSFLGIKFAKISGLSYKGARKNVFLDGFNLDGFQGGDAGLGFFLCDHIVVENCDIREVFSWGIFGTSITKANVHNNYIKDCVHQAGIDISIPAAAEQSSVFITDNDIINCGLYGVEVENHANADAKTIIANNRIKDCFSGITCVNGIKEADIHSNFITNCYYGVFLISIPNSELLEVFNNTITGCFYGVIWQNATQNLRVWKNSIKGTPNTVSYRKASADRFVWAVDSDTTFRTVVNLTVGQIYYINEIPITVAASVASGTYVRDDTATRELYSITVNAAVITDDMKFAHIHNQILKTTVGEAGLVSASSTVVNGSHFNNTCTHNNYGILASGAGTNTSLYSEHFFDNIISNSSIASIMCATDNDAIRSFSLNKIIDDRISNYRNALSSGKVKLKTLERLSIGATSNSSGNITYPSSQLYAENPNKPFYAVRVRLSGISGVASGAELQLAITNGSMTTTFTGILSTYLTTGSFLVYVGVGWVMPPPTWAFRLQVMNADSTLIYSSCELTFMTDS
ncbi:right-handed parallel beta-helix repeat-containing protein [Acinetobacter puyangensis]|uniref:right-handed parallel beta-helix repeat-containing protein n=1 Tax=Acinetobacter puyangensis TaxID=1096779 RepID=UPI003A4D74C3